MRKSSGFSLIELAIVVAILVILGIVAAMSTDAESGDASMVRSVQGSMQAAIMSIAASTRANVMDSTVIDSAATVVLQSGDLAGMGATLTCGTTDCNLTLPSGREADYEMDLVAGFALRSLTGFSRYTATNGELTSS